MSTNAKGYQRKFTLDFQIHILAVVARVPNALARCRSTLHPAYFKSIELQKIASIILESYDEHRTIPAKVSILNRITADITNKETRSTYIKVVKRMFTDDVGDAPAVIPQVVEFGKDKAMVNAIVECAKLCEIGDVPSIRRVIQTASMVGQDAEADILKYTDATVADRIAWDNIRTDTVPTGCAHIDEAMSGGLGLGELGCVLSGFKGGKTTTMINFGYGAATHFTRFTDVLYITAEIRREMIAQRMDARIAGPLWKYHEDDHEYYAKRVTKRVQRNFRGAVWVKGVKTRAFTPSAVEATYLTMRNEGFDPKLLIIDYADILKPESRKGENRFELAGIYEDLRAIAQEYNVAVWTASQAKASSVDKEFLTINDFAEAGEKGAIIDAGIGLMQDPGERGKLRGACRFGILAGRRFQDHKIIEGFIDRERCIIRTLSSAEPVVIKSATPRRNRRGPSRMAPR